MVVVEATDNTTSPDEVRRLVENSLNPISNKLQINKIRTTKTNKIIISTNKSQKEQIKSLINEATGNKCKAREAIDQVPRIVLLNVEKGISKDEVKDAILQQNEELFDSRSQLTVEQEFSKEGSDVNNFVIQTDAETRRKSSANQKSTSKTQQQNLTTTSQICSAETAAAEAINTI